MNQSTKTPQSVLGDLRHDFNRQLSKFNVAHGYKQTVKGLDKVDKRLALAVEDIEPGSVSGEIPLNAFTELPTPTGKVELEAATNVAVMVPMRELCALTVKALGSLINPLEVLDRVSKNQGLFVRTDLPGYMRAYVRLAAVGGQGFRDAFSTVAEARFEKYATVNDKVAACANGNLNLFLGAVAHDLKVASNDLVTRLDILRQFFEHGNEAEVTRLEKALVYDTVFPSLHGEYHGSPINFWTAISSIVHTEKLEFSDTVETICNLANARNYENQDDDSWETVNFAKTIRHIATAFEVKRFIDDIDYFSSVDDEMHKSVAERLAAVLARIMDDAWNYINFIMGVTYLVNATLTIRDLALSIVEEIITDTTFLRGVSEGNPQFVEELRAVRKDGLV